MAWNDVIQAIAVKGNCSDTDMLALDMCFSDGMLDRALELIDRGKVTRWVGVPSEAIVHTVKTTVSRKRAGNEEGEVERAYLVVPGMCTCPAFAKRMVCKHLVAVQLAEALGCATVREQNDEYLAGKQASLLAPLLPSVVPLSQFQATSGQAAATDNDDDDDD